MTDTMPPPAAPETPPAAPAPAPAAPRPVPPPERHGGGGGLFIGLLLVAIGVCALLANLGILNQVAIERLWRISPVALIALGILVILYRTLSRRVAAILGVLVGILILGGAISYAATGAGVVGERTFDFNGPVAGATEVKLVIHGGAVQLNVHGGADIGGDLYRAHLVTPGSGSDPTVTLNGSTLDVQMPDSSGFWFFGNIGAREADITLNENVKWSVDIEGGAQSGTMDFSNVQLTGIAVNGGASNLTATLGLPGRDVPISIGGGASHLVFHAPQGVAAKVTINGGASSMHFDGENVSAFTGGATRQTSTYDTSTSRYTITVDGGASDVTLDHK